MLEIASQIVLCLVLSALIGGVIGYLVCKLQSNKVDEIKIDPKIVPNTPEEEEIEEVLEALEEIETIEKNNSKPHSLKEPIDGKKDNLSTIKGIGPKLEEKLNNIGIFHFHQIANWSEDNIKWLYENADFPNSANKKSWIVQAKELI
jgi:NADH-quinone oxidoreductase subunit E